MKYKIKFLLIILLLNSCTLFQLNKTRTEDLFPREADVPGWRLKVSPENYDNSSIDEYIKDTELLKLYSVYGFKELSIARYIKFSDPQNEIQVEIFYMNSPLNAFGLLSMERPAEIKKADVCYESYSTPGGLFTSKGNYYIRVKSSARYKNPAADLKIFLIIICNKIINPDNSLQSYLSLFGRDSIITLTYKIQGDPRVPPLRRIFTRNIEFSGSEKTIFFAKRKSGYSSIKEFSNLLKDRDNKFILYSAEKIQIAFRKANDVEFSFIALYNEWIFGVLNAETMKQGEKIIYYMYNNLSEYN